jgi:dynein heavy chain
MNLEDLTVLTAMGPPGGGRTFITNRMIRHFNMITYTELDEHTIKGIFNTMVKHFLRRYSDDV